MRTRIKELRKEKNVTQQEIADRLGVSKSYISYVESEKTNITLENAFKIADFLSVTLDELIVKK